MFKRPTQNEIQAALALDFTREVARRAVLVQRGVHDLPAFEHYAQQAESHDGPSYWQGFLSITEFLDDFERYMRFDHARSA